ncbi:hypothetical protein B1207_07500 [Legionella quinlivanii]|uniref:NHL repeat protein n=1 Tax=Legionella quinlivanii TaxID=45073 RepID=A0A364LJX5_9GAMM|nr:hypothetical protein [Legionella quinlivanii]RAP36641.1 hypothetical protein B1207_07500 [Legionella quinlivanii]
MKHLRLTLQSLSLSIFITTVVHAGIPLWSFSPNGSPVVFVSATGTATVSYTVSNNSQKPHRLVLSSDTPTGISQAGGPCVLAARSPVNPNPTCILTLSINGSALPANNVSGGPVLCQANFNGTPNPNQCYQPSSGDTLVITRIAAPDTTTLNAAPSVLGLSVKNTALNPALTGNSRQITIKNTGTNEARGLSIVYPVWPGGTTASSTCGAVLAAGAACTITIHPGSNATSNCNTGLLPTPGTITVSATNVATAVTSNVVLLSYGCQYQGGFLYSVDDTTPNTGSIGGKVASLKDQAAPYTTGSQATSIIWSSNGNGAAMSDVDFTVILGIDDASTTSSPSPTSPSYPPGTPAYVACNGSSDGSCDSSNIVSYYNFNRSSGGSAPTPVAYYAAGLCTATINNYSDWYLSAICEMDAVDNAVSCPAESQSMVANLVFLLGDPNTGTPRTSCSPPSGTDCLAGFYWSSTEVAILPLNNAWVEYFNSSGSGQSNGFTKNGRLGVRCSRGLTL